jgi:hypothetical protein
VFQLISDAKLGTTTTTPTTDAAITPGEAFNLFNKAANKYETIPTAATTTKKSWN